MKRIIGLAVVLVLGVPPAAWAARDDGDKSKDRGCSKETHRLVLEREGVFRLCVFPK